MTQRVLLILLALLALSTPTLAQSDDDAASSRSTQSEKEKERLNRESAAAFDRKDYPAAEKAVRRLTEIDADNFVPWYNLACALSIQGRTEEAGPMLEKAIELGFSDLGHMEVDVYLVNLRKTSNYQKLVAKWQEILGAQAEERLEQAKKRYGAGYTYEKDDKYRLAYVSAFSTQSFTHAKTEIGRLIVWWETYVCPPTNDANRRDRGETPWVLVVMPSPQDYAKWARSKYGEGWERIGGVYSHDEKTLMAKDIGSTLRHEFWHVLHWRNMDVLGQRHPIWIMEGLCSLMEDVEVSADGSARPLPSWRTNQAGQLARVGKLTPWETLFKLNQRQFIGSRPLAFYGQARSIFMWLAEQGKLKEWYAAYTAGYKEDPTGLSAFEIVFKKPVKQIEADWKTWLRKLPKVDEDFPVGGAVLPFDVDPVGAGDGLVVSNSDALDRLSGKPNTAYARAGGIRPKDVILTIDGRAVHEIGELIRVLADYGPGTQVSVTYRRQKQTHTTTVTLMEKR